MRKALPPGHRNGMTTDQSATFGRSSAGGHTAAAGAIGEARAVKPGRGPLFISGAAASLGGAAAYLCALPAYVQASAPAAALLGTAATCQAVLAMALLRRPARRLLAAAAAVAAGILTLWLATRTASLGVRMPLWGPLDTSVGFTDIIDAALESLAALLLAVCAVRWPRRRVRRPVAVAAAAALPVLLAGLLSAAGAGFATNGFTMVTGVSGNLLVPGQRLAPNTTTALTYCSPDSIPLTMEVWEPPAGAPRPAPAVLYVHGGGLSLGSRQLRGLGASLANHAGALFPGVRRDLLARGMAVASIDYRLAPLAPWPAQIEDAQCAVRYLRVHAAALGIAPDRIGAFGSSAGGELAALLGTAPRAGAGPYPAEPSRVQAVADLFGPSDLNAMGNATPFGRAMVEVAFGDSRAVRAAASPVSYIHRGDPPFLVLQGTADPMIRPSQSLMLASRLASAGDRPTLVLVRGASHGINDPSQHPSPAALTVMITSFFAHALGSKG